MSTFEETKKNSIYWFNRANDLRGGAAAVWASYSSESNDIAVRLGLGEGYRMSAALPRVYFMLCGMSLELLLKTIIVARGEKAETTHNLNRLAKAAQVPFEKKHEALLQILTEAVIWDGKYPVPKEEKDWASLIELKNNHLRDSTPVGDGRMSVSRRNDALKWDSYSELWAIALTTMCDVVPWIRK